MEQMKQLKHWLSAIDIEITATFHGSELIHHGREGLVAADKQVDIVDGKFVVANDVDLLFFP